MIRVLVVDDSAVVRKVITEELSRYSRHRARRHGGGPVRRAGQDRGAAPGRGHPGPGDAAHGRAVVPGQAHALPPDAGGHPELADAPQQRAGLKALDLGAVEVLCKPGAAYSTKDIAQPLVHAIRSAAVAKISAAPPRPARPDERRLPENLLVQTTHKIIAIGASTGGTRAIEAVLTRMPRDRARDRHRAAHARALHGLLRPAAERGLRRSRCARRATTTTSCPGRRWSRPGNRHMVLDAQRRDLPGADQGRPAGALPAAERGRAVPLGRPDRGPQRGRRHPDRHGGGRGPRAAGDARQRRLHARPGRGELRRLRHAQGGHQAERRRGGGIPRRHGRPPSCRGCRPSPQPRRTAAGGET